MKITIIGWYGTETIGDRAILAGLLSIFHKAFDDFDIDLGSLYPFFSERTIYEDFLFYKEIIKKDIKINLFNSKKSKELDKSIKGSDLSIMAGGPLMDLGGLFMVEYAFKKAKALGKLTGLLGCGIGPLFRKKYRKSVFQIAMNSDLIILRDSISKNNLKDIYREFNKCFDETKISTSLDPAVQCTLEYNKQNIKKEDKYIAVNLREYPKGYSKNRYSNNINKDLVKFVDVLTEKHNDKEIKLIPMHYFHIGGNDKVFLNSIKIELNKKNIFVQNKNSTLKETIEIYQNAYFNIGMRFHSVVLQTIASGKNYILDYTEPLRGKIFGFLNDIDKAGFYKNRYLSLQEDIVNANFIRDTDNQFLFNEVEVEKMLNIYTEKLSDFFI